MIDLAALTQALERWDVILGPNEDLLPWDSKLIRQSARLVSRLWQPCQTCEGTGTEVTEIRRSPLGSGLPSSMYVIIDEIREECPSCGGVGVEPTPQAIEDVAERLWRQFLSVFDDLTAVHSRWEENIEIHERWRARAHEHLMALWRVANEETP